MIEEQLIDDFNEFLSSTIGIHYGINRIDELKRDLKRIAPKLGFASYEECIKHFLFQQTPTDKLVNLANVITIGETYFFRDQSMYKNLTQNILPSIIQKKREQNDYRIRILSAGCSTGEEPYSLAISLMELLTDPDDWNILIHGVDINSNAINSAINAKYNKWSFRMMDSDIQLKYFKLVDKKYCLSDNIKRMVSFSSLNLVKDDYPSLITNTTALDLILCRNVLMYFRQDIIDKVIEKLVKGLLFGGSLIVSSTELNLIHSGQLKRYRNNDLTYFRKINPFDKREVEPKLTSRNKFNSPKVTIQKRKPTTAGKPKVNIYDQKKNLLVEMNYHYNECSYERASEICNQVLNIDPFCMEAYYIQIRILTYSNKLDEALTLCDKAIGIDKFDYVILYLKALINIERGESQEALNLLDKSIYLNPDFTVAYYVKGNLCLYLDKKQLAQKNFTLTQKLINNSSDDTIVPHADGMTVKRLNEILFMRLEAGLLKENEMKY